MKIITIDQLLDGSYFLGDYKTLVSFSEEYWYYTIEPCSGQVFKIKLDSERMEFVEYGMYYWGIDWGWFYPQYGGVGSHFRGICLFLAEKEAWEALAVRYREMAVDCRRTVEEYSKYAWEASLKVERLAQGIIDVGVNEALRVI